MEYGANNDLVARQSAATDDTSDMDNCTRHITVMTAIGLRFGGTGPEDWMGWDGMGRGGKGSQDIPFETHSLESASGIVDSRPRTVLQNSDKRPQVSTTERK